MITLEPTAAIPTTTESQTTLKPSAATPTISPSAKKKNGDAVGGTSSPVSTEQSSGAAGAPVEPFWMGIAWNPCHNGGTSVTLSCQDGYPLTVHRSTVETTKCESVNATTQQCFRLDDDGTNGTAVILVTCSTRIQVEMPLCNEPSFLTTTTHYCDGQWQAWNSTLCADESQHGNSTSLLLQRQNLEDQEQDEQSYQTPVYFLDEFFENMWGEEEPQDLDFCYARRNCDTDWVGCAAPPLRAEAVPQEACSSSATNVEDELDRAWNALVEESAGLLGDIAAVVSGGD